jgi:hypothetical protein
MNNDVKQLQIVWENSKHKEIYRFSALYLRRPTICIELGNYQDRLRFHLLKGLQEITVIEYNTSHVYAIY